MRFIHAADIHLDRALRGLTFDEDGAAELMTATRTAFTRLVDQAIDRQVAFIIIAGDLFDTDWKDFQTGYFFMGEMARLHKAGIRAILLYGNHDAEQEITLKLTWPDNVRRFDSSKPETIVLDDLGVALHGQSFRRADIRDNLAANYPKPIDGLVNIGVLHSALQGRAHDKPYAPCSLEQLVDKGYSYWALGHVHSYEVLSHSPWVVFPGSLQGLHIKEAGSHGAVIVSVEDGVVGPPERLCVDVLRWMKLEVSVENLATLDEVAVAIRRALESAASAAEGRAICCRITLTGRTPIHGEIFAQHQRLMADAKAQTIAASVNGIQIERLKIESQPMLTPQDLAARGDAVADLQKYLSDAAADSEFLKSLKSDLDVMVSKLPSELLDGDFPTLCCIRDGELAELIESAVPAVLDRISREN